MSGPLLSVVIPTYNEAANIGPLLEALGTALGAVKYEAIVVDDDSTDGTVADARSKGARVIVRTDERGLATAVVRGLREAKGEYVAVMDADFQHPPEAVARLLEKAVADNADLVIGSRYAPGGTEGGFGPVRRVISWGAKTLGRIALPPIRRFKVTDPVSGLFLVRRAAIDVDALRPAGYKILIEILARSALQRVSEVGYVFGGRRGGESKLGAGVMAQYLTHVTHLGFEHPDNRRLAIFGIVGLTGVAVNLVLLYVLHGRFGLHDLVAVPIAVEVSILSNFLLNDRFTFHDRLSGTKWRRLLQFNAVSLMALVINVTVYAAMERLFGLPYLLAEFIAIVVAFGANYAGNLHWTYGGADRFRLRASLGRILPVVPILTLGLAAGLVYFEDLDRVNEIYFDEHYYVSVARQADNGILEDPCWVNDSRLPHRPLNYEHPPVAKLIMSWSVERFDTDHAIFEGCRSPDDSNPQTCNLVEHGEVISTHNSRKECYDAFTARAKTMGNPFAWRGPSAVFGALTVLFTGLAARRLFQSTAAGMFGAGLVVLDTLVYSSSRVAILDIFPAAFLMMAIWAATFPGRKGVLATALFLGLAFSCKYTVLFAGPPVALLCLWTQRRAGVLTRSRFDLNLAAFILIPLTVWLASYAPWWNLWVGDMGFKEAVKHWFDVQKEAFAWGSSGYQDHPYESPPGEWFIMGRPTFYYHVWGFDDRREGWVFAIGNPVLWWFAATAILGALGTAFTRWLLALRDGWIGPLAHFRGEPRILQASVIATFLPLVTYAAFFLVDRVTFLFYMTLVVPLLCLPLAGVLGDAWARGTGWRIGVVGVMLAVAAAFVWYYPVASAWRITPEWYDRIMTALPWMDAPPSSAR